MVFCCCNHLRRVLPDNLTSFLLMIINATLPEMHMLLFSHVAELFQNITSETASGTKLLFIPYHEKSIFKG